MKEEVTLRLGIEDVTNALEWYLDEYVFQEFVIVNDVKFYPSSGEVEIKLYTGNENEDYEDSDLAKDAYLVGEGE